MKFFFLEFKYGSNVPFWTSRKKQQIGGLHKFYVTTQKFFIKYQKLARIFDVAIS